MLILREISKSFQNLLLRNTKIVRVDDVRLVNNEFTIFDVRGAVLANMPPPPPEQMGIMITTKHWKIFQRQYIAMPELFQRGIVIINERNGKGEFRIIRLAKDDFALTLNIALAMHSLKMIASITSAEKERDNQQPEGNVVPFVRPT